MASADKLWFLVWRRKGRKPYATSVCGYLRGECLKQCLEIFGDKAAWRKARREGASIEKIAVVLPAQPD